LETEGVEGGLMLYWAAEVVYVRSNTCGGMTGATADRSLAVGLVVCGHDEDERAALRSVIALAASGYEVDRVDIFDAKWVGVER
jgi:hypothetical protein